MKFFFLFILVALTTAQGAFAEEASFNFPPSYPYADVVGTATTTAVAKDDAAIVAWATTVASYTAGTNVDPVWQDATKGLGAAEGTSFNIVCLGRGGEITLEFQQPIIDGTGADFAVFENSFSNQFLELAWVEVSSDGIHFLRFPNFSQTPSPVGGFGTIDAKKIHGFAGKYRAGYGTPFDLAEIRAAHAASLLDSSLFPSSYSADLLANFDEVDFDNIRYIRLIDVVGDGSQYSALRFTENQGSIIYDPYPTTGSAGFDLDAVAVIHQLDTSGASQTIDFSPIGNQRFADVAVGLEATASSGLAVTFEVVSGPALLDGAELNFTGLGLVSVQAIQSGDESYSAALPIVQNFYVADELQHIFIVPPSNQLVAVTGVAFTAVSSSGLPVSLFVEEGPEDAFVGELSHLFASGPVAGEVTLRAVQNGGTQSGITYAPADEVLVDFAIVAVNSEDAPLSFDGWQSLNGISGSASHDSDKDGQTDLEEYLTGTDPHRADDDVRYPLVALEDAFVWTIRVDRRAQIDLSVESISDLSDVNGWTEWVPEMLDVIPISEVNERCFEMRLRLPVDSQSARFWRLNLQAE
ncbi:MAG: hypothetical protein MK130_00870 [Puniceicoccaceae bacterium]|nr:hypothetical protein [Puniceicoccaceae bacterium]